LDSAVYATASFLGNAKETVDLPALSRLAAELFDRVIPRFSGMPEIAENNPEAATIRRTPRRGRQPAPESFDPRRGPGGIDLASEEDIPAPQPSGGMANGAAIIRTALKNVPAGPGVYRMLDRKGDAIYVGKARNLKARVQNYTHPLGLSNRLRRMVAETAALEIVVTATEAEALLLECNMIKRLLPRFNVLLRDDKSFPLIHITAGHEFPRLTKHRGARADDGAYFGPFASAGAVNRTLITLGRDSRVALRATQTRLDAFFANAAIGISSMGEMLSNRSALSTRAGARNGRAVSLGLGIPTGSGGASWRRVPLVLASVRTCFTTPHGWRIARSHPPGRKSNESSSGAMHTGAASQGRSPWVVAPRW